MLAFGLVDINAITACVLIAAFSSLPDLDLPWHLEHRGPTHSLFAGLLFGIFLAIIMEYAHLGWMVGFVAGFGGTILHLLGDIFTKMPIKPFWPFSQHEVSLGLFNAKNSAANNGFFGLGFLAFLAVILRYAGYL